MCPSTSWPGQEELAAQSGSGVSRTNPLFSPPVKFDSALHTIACPVGVGPAANAGVA